MSPLHIPGRGETLHVYSRDWRRYKLPTSLWSMEKQERRVERQIWVVLENYLRFERAYQPTYKFISGKWKLYWLKVFEHNF